MLSDSSLSVIAERELDTKKKLLLLAGRKSNKD